jgi:hypothetical protein
MIAGLQAMPLWQAVLHQVLYARLGFPLTNLSGTILIRKEWAHR